MQLIARLRDRKIRIRAVGNELEVDAPKGALDDELRDAIVANRDSLLRLLSWSRRSSRATGVPLVPVPRDRPLPLSWAQQRLWFLDQLEPGNPAYNISWTVRLRGELNVSALEQAFGRVVARHESLRTRFPARDGVAEQQIVADADVSLERVDASSMADEQLRTELSRLAGYRFNLEHELLIRPTLLKLADDEHILLVVVHHIVADGASMRILFRELAAFYEAEPDGDPAALPPLPLQYADYAVWQRSWLDSDELDRQSEYWQQQLQGLPPLLELPADRPRAAAMRYRGAAVLRVLSPELTAGLRRLSREHGCTLFMTMLAAFYVLLMRYSGREDLVVGTPLGGRSRTQLEGLIGFFINTVVLRADLSGNPTFAQLLSRVRDVALEAHANQDLPFEKLVEIIRPERELSYSPVFQVMFDLQEEPRWKLPVRNLEVMPEVVFSSRTSSFDLTLSVRQAEQGLDAMFEYDTDLFDEVTIETMGERYQTLLEAIVADASCPIADLPLTDPAAERDRVHRWNTVEAAYPKGLTITDLFMRQVDSRPHAEALRDGVRRYTYRQLDAVANAVATRLCAEGVVPDEPVALCARHAAETVIAALAIHKAGGCVVPLDPAYPAARLRGMLADSGASLLVHASDDTALAESLVAGERCRAIGLTPASCAPGAGSEAGPPPRTGARNLAYLMYTSGTTGRPKGVLLEHAGFVNYITQLARMTELSDADRVLQFASPSFDIAIEESLSALLNGATLVMREPVMSQSTADFVSGCEQHGITWLSLPTAWWHELCESLERGDLELPKSLRAVVIGGEKAEREALRKWHRHAVAVRLFNTYGPTETTIATAWIELTHLDPDGIGEVPLGYPVPNTRVWVMDDRLRPVPPGLPGEICISGVGLARGYHGLAEQESGSAKAFETVELPDGSSERVYRTGDRGRYVAEHGLMFLGRRDGQIKLRGHRIEPAEVESALAELPGAGRSAVVPCGDGPAMRLVAYTSGPGDPEELRDALRARLPEYMVPAVVIRVPKLPFTANGKLDRQALPDPQPTLTARSRSRPPETPLQQQLAEIWAEALGIPEPGIHDDFFELGGHSLLATRVIARIRDRCSATVPLRALFDQPTIAQLARVVEAEGRSGGLPAPEPRGDAQVFAPLSWAQQRLWMLDQLEPGNSAYNLGSAVWLSAAPDMAALQSAVDDIVRRHHVLRTVFAEHRGEAVQLVQDDIGVTVCVEALAASDEQAVQRALCERIDQPFALSRGPLFRVHVLALPDGRHVLLLVLHHIVADGWSMSVLYGELQQYYAAALAGRLPPGLKPLPIQYADYAVWQRDVLPAHRVAAEQEWLRSLEGAPPILKLPLDFERPPVQTYNGAWVSAEISSTLAAQLRAFATGRSCSLFMVLLTGFKALLYRHTGVEDIVVGTPVAGRTHTHLESLIGCFLNTLVLRTRTGSNPDFAELLNRVRRTSLEAFERQDIPFERLLEVLQPPRSAAYTPLVQVLFNLHTERGGNLQLAGLDCKPLMPDRAAAKFDLSVSIAEQGDGLLVGFEYNTDLFRHESIEAMLGHYVVLLETMVEKPTARIADVWLASGDSHPAGNNRAGNNRVGTRPGVADTAVPDLPADPPADATIDARFREVVAARAEAPALDDGDAVLSYHELDAWCTAVARAVTEAQAAGTSVTQSRESLVPAAPVGLLLRHGAAAVAGVLGVLRAGYAYVPLDTAWPTARLQAVLDAAGVVTVLTDQPSETLLADSPVRRVAMPDRRACVALPVAPRAEPDERAYILFTSGTTGKPKGVMQTQRNVLHHVAVYAASIGVRANDKLVQFAHFGFDAAVMDMFGALLTGACLKPLDVTALDGEALDGALRDVTVLHTTPTVFRHITAAVSGDHTFRSVRAVVLGGEEALADDFDRFCTMFPPDAVFVNGLGPSESTTALQFRAYATDRLPGRRVPVGVAVPGVDIELLDPAGRPAGLRGELVIRSAYVSPGYLNEPDLTARKMRDGRYFTGDILRRLPDGNYVYEGRTDAQLKISGRRIEPAEVEEALARLPGVDECAVFGADNALAAGYTGEASARELRALLRRQLPPWLVPARLIRLAGLPLRPNGKVDYDALRELARGVAMLPAATAEGVAGREYGEGIRDDSATDGYVAPRPGPERDIAEIFQTLLGVESVSAHDDFFALGGHSLLAMQLLARLRERFGIRIGLADLFAAPSPAELADRVASASQQVTDGIPLRPRESGVLVPLSWAQQRLWFLDQLEPGNAAYNLHWVGRLNGRPDVTILEAALNDVVARHESLRTAFTDHAGEPVQVVHRSITVPLVVEPLDGAEEAVLRRRALELIRQPFDLRSPPLWRAYLLDAGPEETWLVLILHHIIADGWSMGVLFDDLSRYYAARRRGEPARLEPLPVQYPDYALWQRARLTGPELDRQNAFWATQLADAPPLIELPLDKPRPPVQRFRGAWVSTVFDRALLDGIRALAEARSATVFMVLLTAFKVLLVRHTGRTDMVVGAPVAGRPHSEVERLIGFFLNTLVLRTHIPPDATFASALQAVRETTLAAYDHQDLPFEKLLEVLRPPRSTAHSPLVQVTINLHNEPGSVLSLDGLGVEVLTIDRGTSKFDLSLSLIESREGLRAGFEYNTDLFARETVQRLLLQLGELLQAFVANPETLIAEPVLSSDYRVPVIARDYRAWGHEIAATRTSGEHGVFAPAASGISRRFADVVAEYGDRPAIIGRTDTLTYRQLAERASEVAGAVRAHIGAHAGPNGQQRVALLLGHDSRAVAGLLGVLQAGHAFVFLDPRAPAARQRRIIELAQPALLITDDDHAAAVPPESGVPVLRFEALREGAAVSVVTNQDGPDSISATVAGQPDLAYLLFTSGTTGEPKAVMQTQDNVLRHIRVYTDALRINADDRLTLLAAFGFDAAIMDVFGALMNGAALVPLELQSEEYPGEVLDKMTDARVTVLHATPTVFRFLMRSKVCRHDLSTVRAVVLGGEEAYAGDFELFRQQFAPPAVFINGLGPSESTLAAQFIADHQTRLPGNQVPVGSPVAGTELRLLDERGQETALCGELAIVSDAVAPGYWREPELTVSRFTRLPDGRTLYRTGDRVRRLPDGQLIFEGRIDNQIKLRGVRIEPAEVEAAVAACPGVQDVAVILDEGERPDDARLVAYYTGDAQADAVREMLRRQLPEFMVPAICMPVAALPRTANGKLDRARLPRPERSAGRGADYVAPRTETERQLERIWVDILGVPQVSVHDDFFALGGHSLLAAQLAARVNESLQVTIPLRRLFDEPTIGALAQHIDNLRWMGEA